MKILIACSDLGMRMVRAQGFCGPADCIGEEGRKEGNMRVGLGSLRRDDECEERR